MTNQEALAVVQKTIDTFQAALGDGLETCYLYGSLAGGGYIPHQSDVNLLFIVEEGTSIHTLRDIFQPLWQQYQEVLKRPPLFTSMTVLIQHLRLFPAFVTHLKHCAQLQYGDPFPLTLLAKDQRAPLTHLAQEIMMASQALMPALLPPEEQEPVLLQLNRLARKIGVQAQLTDEPVSILAQIYQKLQPALAQFPPAPPNRSQPDAPPMLPDLQAMYESAGKLIFAFPQLRPERILKTDWQEVAELVQGQATGLQLTTTAQLQAIVQYEHPLEYTLLNYNHEWGDDILADLDLSVPLTMREAARLPSLLEMARLPKEYLTHDDDYMGTLIHDFQNNLLNIQLRHELLVRLGKITPDGPANPLPGRETPPKQRIDAIVEHLQWWASYYTQYTR